MASQRKWREQQLEHVQNSKIEGKDTGDSSEVETSEHESTGHEENQATDSQTIPRSERPLPLRAIYLLQAHL